MPINNYPTGTIIKCSISGLPFIYHMGVILNEGNGILKVAHNTLKKNKYGGGIHIDNLETFLHSRSIEQVTYTKLTRQIIVDSVKKYYKVPFNLFLWNCEHYVWKVQTGRAQSPQLRNAAKFAVYLTFLILAITKNPLKKMKPSTILTVLAILVFFIGGYFVFIAVKAKNKRLSLTKPPEVTPPAISNPEPQNPEIVIIDEPGTVAQPDFWDNIPVAQ